MLWAFKHAVASAATALLLLALTFVAYFGLLAWAVVAGADLGGPLALPFMLLLAVLLCAVLLVGFLQPATVLAEFTRSRLRLHRIAEIPLASLISLVPCALSAWCLRACEWTSADFVELWLVLWLLVALPLGFYWWVGLSIGVATRAVLALFAMLARVVRGLSKGLAARIGAHA